MTKPKLTDPRVIALKPRPSDYVEWCGHLPGFGVRIRPTGSKSLVIQYDFGGRKGVTRRVTLGAFPKVGVEEARKKAKEILAKVALGEDVAAERSKQRAAVTMAELCDVYLKKGCKHKKASTIATDKGRIERHIKPLLGKRAVNLITKADVKKFVHDVAEGKTAKALTNEQGNRVVVTGGEGTATRTLRLLGGIFTYAINEGYIETNPRAGVKGYKDNLNTRFLESDKLAQLGDTLRLAETEGLPWRENDGVQAKHRAKPENARETICPHAIAAIRLLLLTGCRLGEILNLRWDDISFERATLHLTDSKTGAKDVYLSAPALEVLSDIPRIEGNPYVVAGSNPKKPRSDLKRPWIRITEHAGLDGLRLHDLRHSYASVGAASGMGLLFVGKLLGHASTSTTQRYAHLANDPLRQANETIGQQIANSLLGVKTDRNVTHIKRGLA